VKNIKEAIQKSKRILVTSHINCDQDGICSALATKLILEKNFPGKKALANIESKLQKNISFLKDFSKIKTEDLFEKIEEYKPDLIIFTDSSTLSRFSDNHSKVKEIIKKEKIQTILIDHHISESDTVFDLKYNNHRSSCAEEIYHLFVKEMGLDIDTDIAEVIMTGMIFDTGVFKYDNKFFRETANVVADLVEMGVNMEKILSFKDVYKKEYFDVFTQLNENLILKNDFCYSFITEEFFKSCTLTSDEYKHAYQTWMELFLKNIEGCKWGFIIRAEGNNEYFVSFRSQEGAQNVRVLAEKFGGGGHDYASGATLQGKNIDSVIEKILAKIL
jgi:bifunctional oligoribonuclease and PAP phosphatase NrnA